MLQEKNSPLCQPKPPNLSNSGSLSMVGVQFLRIPLPDPISRNAPPSAQVVHDDDDLGMFDVASVLQEALDLSDRARFQNVRLS
jgi:hypothetical protein